MAKLVQIYAKTFSISIVEKNGQKCVKEIKAQKGIDSHWPKENFRHPFKELPEIERVKKNGYRLLGNGDLIVKRSGFHPIYGVKSGGYLWLQSGDQIIHGTKILWKFFKYSQRDITGSRKG